MKKLLVVGVIVLFLCMSISSSGFNLENQSTIAILDGNTLYVGGNGTGNYSKIQDAINDASDGDTVYVYNDSSPYYENVRVNKAINLIGENKNTTIINGYPSNDYVILLQASNVTLTGFTLRGCIFVNGAGIYITSSFNIIHQNIIINNYKGIKTVYKDSIRNQLYDNTIMNADIGIALSYESSNQTVFNNSIYETGTGIETWFSSNHIIYGNHIISNYNAIDIYFSSNNKIFSNYISNNTRGMGLVLGNKSNNLIFENEIVNNKIGIYVRDPYDNYIFHNNIINNTQNANDECNNSWDNGYPSCGNYWDDYNGTDTDGDGVGDVPYNISGGDNSDRYPLMEPYGMTELSLNFRSGLFKFSGGIKNIGNHTAFNVQWKITIDGGLVILGKESSGTIPKPLLVGEETKVSSNFVLGFGKIMITVAAWADNAPLVSKSTPGFLFLFFIQINPGGGI